MTVWRRCASLCGSEAATAARDRDYKPWITHASAQKHKSTVGFGPGPAFTQLVLCAEAPLNVSCHAG